MMQIVQLRIPPLPQFLTGGNAVWPVGRQHFERSFEVYVLLLVYRGTLYMTEDNIAYPIREGELLLLEPGRAHFGHKPCDEPTEIYWIHFKHEAAVKKLLDEHLSLSVTVKEGADSDLQPREQFLYLPKYGPIDQKEVRPTLDKMLQLRKMLPMEHAIDLQVLLGELLSQLQSSLRSEERGSRSYAVAQKVTRYLEMKVNEPYQAANMRKELHFDEDYAARCLRKHTGLSPIQYHRIVKMEEAKRLLRNSSLTLQEIGYRVGYTDHNYFIRVFRKTVGTSPGVYRKNTRGFA